jgi:hypothetical protein
MVFSRFLVTIRGNLWRVKNCPDFFKEASLIIVDIFEVGLSVSLHFLNMNRTAVLTK